MPYEMPTMSQLPTYQKQYIQVRFENTKKPPLSLTV